LIANIRSSSATAPASRPTSFPSEPILPGIASGGIANKSKGISNLRNYVAIVLIVFVPILAVAGERERHNPYTVLGMWVRSHLVPETPGANGQDLGPLVFQEIVPCRFVSTLEADQYRDPWGGGNSR
jgi:hypothetical protein